MSDEYTTIEEAIRTLDGVSCALFNIATADDMDIREGNMLVVFSDVCDNVIDRLRAILNSRN